MIKIKTFIFNPFQENTYLLYDETREAVIIDPGCFSAQEEIILVNFIEEYKLKPVRILNTHCHIDHILGNHYLSKKYQIKVEAHRDDEFLAKNAKNYGSTFGIQLKESPNIDKFISENDEIVFGNSKLQIAHVPGHSPGGIVFYNIAESFMIVGDVLFLDSIGRTDLPGGNYNDLISNIKNKLFPLGDKMKVYSGHGSSTTIGNERIYNPFLS
jgi:glyoxylase-like metal-dependent hydrolase (beta-lactamase superfamily II)